MSNLREALVCARSRLHQAGIEDADVEAEVLLRYALAIDRVGLFQHFNEELAAEDRLGYEALLARRLAHEPTAYITGGREFYGRDFRVTPATLIPRPETELLVEAAIEVAQLHNGPRGSIVADIGTGSGAVAITLALELPRAEVYAIDVSPEALLVARRNAGLHDAGDRVAFRRGNLLDGLDTRLDLIVANLPYVTFLDWQALPAEIRDFEPRLALEAGSDGLGLIRQLLRQATAYLRPGGAICLEFGAGQAEALRALAGASFPAARIEIRDDLAGRPRALLLRT